MLNYEKRDLKEKNNKPGKPGNWQLDLNTPLQVDYVMSNPFSSYLVFPLLLTEVTRTAQINCWINVLRTKSHWYPCKKVLKINKQHRKQEARQTIFFFSTFQFFTFSFCFPFQSPKAWCTLSQISQNIKNI